jgi:hypothetical protein
MWHRTAADSRGGARERNEPDASSQVLRHGGPGHPGRGQLERQAGCGEEDILTLRLRNVGTQFGRPKGTTVGRALMTCTVMLVDRTKGTYDGNCLGIAHVPDGFFTFEGNGGLGKHRIVYYAITGGVGAYADSRGQIKVVGHQDGSSASTVMLHS